ncbi:MAG: cyclic 2,3-diphosphoglycerate synthase [Ilumatobacter sp.]|nr:cyclic 2,3-diphosphoglycerate synthase [Ilumatobacter sp.]
MTRSRTRVLILGAGGRDFHDFNVAFRDDASVEVVAFTAAQIPNIAHRVYPPELAGPNYPNGIPIRPETELEQLIDELGVDEVVVSYSDLAYVDVMHLESRILAAGADVRLLGPVSTMLESAVPVVAVLASRTGCGKSQTSRHLGKVLTDAGHRVALVRHPMPYGDLAPMRVQRFATLEDIDAADPTIEEREEYEEPVRRGLVMFAGVDYAAILEAAQAEADVIIWDGGNNDLPFFRPHVSICLVDALRPGHEVAYHPGEVNLRMADIVVITKVDAASPGGIAAIRFNIATNNPDAVVVEAASPITLDPGPGLAGARVLVVEDGPTVTHGGMRYGAGTVAARTAGAAELVDPRPWAVGQIAKTFEQYPDIGPLLPAMGYGAQQLADLQTTMQQTPCDVVVTGTPIDLGRLVDPGHPLRHARYEYADAGTPTLADALVNFLGAAAATVG